MACAASSLLESCSPVQGHLLRGPPHHRELGATGVDPLGEMPGPLFPQVEGPAGYRDSEPQTEGPGPSPCPLWPRPLPASLLAPAHTSEGLYPEGLCWCARPAGPWVPSTGPQAACPGPLQAPNGTCRRESRWGHWQRKRQLRLCCVSPVVSLKQQKPSTQTWAMWVFNGPRRRPSRVGLWASQERVPGQRRVRCWPQGRPRLGCGRDRERSHRKTKQTTGTVKDSEGIQACLRETVFTEPPRGRQ